MIFIAFAIGLGAIIIDTDGKFDLVNGNGKRIKLYSERPAVKIYKTKEEEWAARGLRKKEGCYIQGVDNCLEYIPEDEK